MDKYRIQLILRLVLTNQISQSEAVNDILEIFKNSKRFNCTNFFAGLSLGALIGVLTMGILLS